MNGLSFDIAHLLAGGLVLVSFTMLYQDRLYALLNVFALQAVVLAASVAWQAWAQGAPHLYITAAIALGLKAIIIPLALHPSPGSASSGRSKPWSASAPP
jgi:hydrogenase-4 component E